MILVVTPNPCLDRTLFVKENKLEKHIEVQKVQEIAGGKGSNVCRVLQKLGKTPLHLLFLGGYVGKRIFRLLQLDNVESRVVWTKAMTRVVITVVDEHWCQTVYFDPPPKIEKEELDHFLVNFETLCPQAEMVLLCGSVPPSISCLYEEVLKRGQNKRVFLDGRGRILQNLSRYPFGIKMNREEAEFTWGKELQKDSDWEEFFNFFLNRGVEMVILTMGAKGAVLGTPCGFYRATAPQIQVINPVGSGDAFLGAFAYAFSSSFPLEESLRWAVAAGAYNATVWEAGQVETSWIETIKDTIKIERGKSWSDFAMKFFN
ncbi:MAG: 1-phosphofructokinase family hexose kinase [Candidatus Caldatribacteriaceae bacterium]